VAAVIVVASVVVVSAANVVQAVEEENTRNSLCDTKGSLSAAFSVISSLLVQLLPQNTWYYPAKEHGYTFLYNEY